MMVMIAIPPPKPMLPTLRKISSSRPRETLGVADGLSSVAL